MFSLKHCLNGIFIETYLIQCVVFKCHILPIVCPILILTFTVILKRERIHPIHEDKAFIFLCFVDQEIISPRGLTANTGIQPGVYSDFFSLNCSKYYCFLSDSIAYNLVILSLSIF